MSAIGGYLEQTGKDFRKSPDNLYSEEVAGLGMLKMFLKMLGQGKKEAGEATGLGDLMSPKKEAIFGRESALAKKPGPVKDRIELSDMMMAKGASKDEIWDKTKTFQHHPDGGLRFEVSQNNEDFLSAEQYRGIEDMNPIEENWNMLRVNSELNTYKERMKNSPISENYNVDDLKFHSDNEKDGADFLGERRRTYDGGIEGIIGISEGTAAKPVPYEKILANVRHEGNHAVAAAEGWSKGGTPEGMAKELWAMAQNRVKTLEQKQIVVQTSAWTKIDQYNLDAAKKDMKRFSPENKHAWNLDAHAAYEDLADEMQSRVVADRGNKSQDWMDANAFWKDPNYNLDRMIIKDRSTGKIMNRKLLEKFLTPQR